MKIDRNKVRKAVADYVYFLLDNSPKDKTDVMAFDSKRKKLHEAIFEKLSDKPDDNRDEMISEWLSNPIWKDYFKDVEDYIDYNTDRLIDMFHNKRVKIGNGIEIDWEKKERIDWMIKTQKKHFDKRIAEVDKVMERAQNRLKDWNDDHPDSKYLATWDVGINDHDWNAFKYSINRHWDTIKALSELPREAYTKLVVETYLGRPLNDIEILTKKLESIAFRAERNEYYNYEKHIKENEQR